MPEKPDWQRFYRNTKEKPPSGLLVRALEYVRKRDTALDLGSGALNDSKFLLNEHFLKVIAVDKEPLPRELLQAIQDDRFNFVQSSFEDFPFPENAFDLANAQYSLPFVGPESFDAVWKRLGDSIAAGGIFTGQFFGIRDEWNVPGKDMTFHDETRTRELLAGFETLSFQERDFDGKLASGEAKHWHVFHVIARKL